MERLTFKVHDGGIFVKGSDVKTFDVEDEIMHTGNAIRKLAEYEDLEEQGLLLKLPCKVGDTLYRIDTDEEIEKAEIEHCTIDNIVICEDGEVLFKDDAYDGVICHLENIITDNPYLDFYRVFLTQAEAEEALKRMEREE